MKPGLWIVLAVGLLFAAPAVAQESSVLGASVTLEYPLDLTNFREKDMTSTNLVTEPTSSCGTDHFTVELAYNRFRFDETETEHGCGEAMFEFHVPPGAESMDVVFRAERDLRQRAGEELNSALVQVIQEVNVYDSSDDQSEVDGRLIFPLDEPRASTGPTPLVLALTLPPAEDILIGWAFKDEGAALENEVLVTPVVGQALTAQVADASIRFHGVDATDVKSKVVRGAANRDSVTVETHVQAGLPTNLPSNAIVSLRFQVLDPLTLSHIETPSGARVHPEVGYVTLANGVVDVLLDEQLIASHGPGIYTAVFVSHEQLQAAPLLAFGVIAAMIFPIPTGIYATRGAREFEKLAVGVHRTTALVLQRSLYAWWAIYALLLGIVFGTRMWPLIAAWPLELPAALVQLGFAGVAAAFLFTALYWRRQLVNVMELDLQDKQQRNLELSRSNQELEQFAYVASHDLQEPLRTISRFTQLLQHRYAKMLPEEANEFMEFTVDGATRMQGMVDDLLDYSRVGITAKDFEDVPLGEVVDQVLTGLTVAIEEKHATITQDELPVVHGDRLQIAQVYQNLIQNAMKFRTSNRRPKIHLSATKDGSGWRLSVQDNGIGIEPEQHERIFVIFNRLNAPDAFEGTGIGLAVVKKIVERHGGRIWLESVPKKGTTFFFWLPSGEPKSTS